MDLSWRYGQNAAFMNGERVGDIGEQSAFGRSGDSQAPLLNLEQSLASAPGEEGDNILDRTIWELDSMSFPTQVDDGALSWDNLPGTTFCPNPSAALPVFEESTWTLQNPWENIMTDLTTSFPQTINHTVLRDQTWQTFPDQQFSAGYPPPLQQLAVPQRYNYLEDHAAFIPIALSHASGGSQNPIFSNTNLYDSNAVHRPTNTSGIDFQAHEVSFHNSRLPNKPQSSRLAVEAFVPNSHIPLAVVSNVSENRPPVGRRRTKQAKRTRGLTVKQRQKAAEVRDIGACLRCRIYKVSCTEFGTCIACKKSLSTAKIFKEPCYREHLDKVVTIRLGNSHMGEKRSEFPTFEWRSEGQMREVELAYPFDHGSHSSPILKLKCQKFKPLLGQVLSEEWEVDGEVQVFELPPFACCEGRKVLQQRVATFLSQCHPQVEEAMMDTTTDEIIKLTMTKAIDFANDHPKSIIHNALRVRSGVFLLATMLSMQGSEKLDIGDIHIKTPPYFNVPLPPALEYQIDTAAIFALDDLQKTVLKGLNKLVFNCDRTEAWFEVFLVMFVLLSTLEIVYEKQQVYLEWHKHTKHEHHVASVARSMQGMWQYSANNLINHFRVVFRGQTPFSFSSWDQDKKGSNGLKLNTKSNEYLKEVIPLVNNRRHEFESSRNTMMPYCHFLWLSKLFIP